MQQNGFQIAFFGSSLVSAYWNGAATYYRGIIRAIHELGHKVTFYEPDAFDRQKHRDIPDPDYARSVIYSAEDESGVVDALKDARHADIIIKASGVGVFDEFLEAAVLELKSKDRVVAFWDVDAPATLNRIASDPEDPFRNLIPRYDIVLTYGGGDPVINGYAKWGAAMCVPIYNAVDPDTHFRVPPDERFNGRLGFLGNRMPDREERVWEFFFKPARELADSRFILGGNGWGENIPEEKNIRYVGHVYTRDHNTFNSTPSAILNINRDSMAEYGWSPPTRVFEAAGSGACIITDAWEGIGMFLEPGSECLIARNGEEVIEHLNFLTEERARAIGEAGLRRILSEHTYAHRGRQLENMLKELKS